MRIGGELSQMKRKDRISGNGRSMHGYILTYSKLSKGSLWQFLALSRWNPNFCLRGVPPTGNLWWGHVTTEGLHVHIMSACQSYLKMPMLPENTKATWQCQCYLTGPTYVAGVWRRMSFVDKVLFFLSWFTVIPDRHPISGYSIYFRNVYSLSSVNSVWSYYKKMEL